MDENKWEYNYSSSDNTAGGTGYPNVGSSGMNTANQYNNEPEAMRDIMMIYGGLRRPILVLFLTDGRLQSDWEIEEYLYRI